MKSELKYKQKPFIWVQHFGQCDYLNIAFATETVVIIIRFFSIFDMSNFVEDQKNIRKDERIRRRWQNKTKCDEWLQNFINQIYWISFSMHEKLLVGKALPLSVFNWVNCQFINDIVIVWLFKIDKYLFGLGIRVCGGRAYGNLVGDSARASSDTR